MLTRVPKRCVVLPSQRLARQVSAELNLSFFQALFRLFYFSGSTQASRQVDVSEVVVGSDPNAVYMVMEFMDHELKALMDTMPRPFSTAEVCPLPGRASIGL